MRVIIQRVKKAILSVKKELPQENENELEVFSKINQGIICFIGIHRDDTIEDISYIVKKCLNLKLWSNNDKRWDKSVSDLDYEILLVSQFTLFAITNKGNKPDFHLAIETNKARSLFNIIFEEFKRLYKTDKIKIGKFGNYMNIDVTNDGPVTIFIDSRDR